MEPFLSVSILLLIALITLFVFVPAGLERRAHRNRLEREAVLDQLRELEKAALRYERTLSPYRSVRSSLFRDAATAAGIQITQLVAHLQRIAASTDALLCPLVPAFLLPVQHFLSSPRDMPAILGDARRLSRLRTELRAAGVETTAGAAALVELGMLPQRMTEIRRALVARLDAVDSVLRNERAAGIEALGEWEAASRRERERLARQQADTPAGAPVRVLDAGALTLEEVERACGRLEEAVASLALERARIDARLDRVAAELDNLQAGTKSEPFADAPPETSRLRREAARLLNESAPASRRSGDFAAAETAIVAASRLIVLARDIRDAKRAIQLLESRDYGALTDSIAALDGELIALTTALESVPAEGTTAVQFATRAAELRRRAGALVVQQDAAVAELERQAGELHERIERQWASAQGLLRLDDEDPLTRRFVRLSADYEIAQRQPAALEEFRRNVTGFESVLNPWMARISSTQELIERNRARLPDLIDAAMATAGPWQCREHVKAIQQRAADFERLRGRFSVTRHRRQAETLMDQLEAVESEIDERFAVLREQAARLGFLEQDVRQITTMTNDAPADLAPDDPVRQRRERALGLIAHHTAQAHSAARYEDASLSLSRAADLANKMAL